MQIFEKLDDPVPQLDNSAFSTTREDMSLKVAKKKWNFTERVAQL